MVSKVSAEARPCGGLWLRRGNAGLRRQPSQTCLKHKQQLVRQRRKFERQSAWPNTYSNAFSNSNSQSKPLTCSYTFSQPFTQPDSVC